MDLRNRRSPNERLVVLAGLGVASALCLALELLREHRYGAYDFRFLIWNLILAWIPLLLALLVYDRYRRGRSLLVLAPALLLWVLFLPNAPYIVTDFVHVGRDWGVPIWFDATLTASFAGTGLVLGLLSVLLVQSVLARRYGSAVGWLMLPPILLLCSTGIYLGRVHRFNSWDAVTRPHALIDTFTTRLSDPFARPEAIVALLGLMGMLAVAYLVVYTISDLRLDEPHRPERD
jgi:uncharacterized membrane protein